MGCVRVAFGVPDGECPVCVDVTAELSRLAPQNSPAMGHDTFHRDRPDGSVVTGTGSLLFVERYVGASLMHSRGLGDACVGTPLRSQ